MSRLLVSLLAKRASKPRKLLSIKRHESRIWFHKTYIKMKLTALNKTRNENLQKNPNFTSTVKPFDFPGHFFLLTK